MNTRSTAEPVDLTAFLPTDTATIEVLTADGRPTGWNIDLAGPSHPQTIDHNEQAARRSLRRATAIEQAQVNGKKYKAEERTPDDVRRENVEDIVARIIDWTPIKIGGEIISFSKQAALELLMRPDMGWAYVQLSEAFGDEKRFMQRSVKL